MDTTTEWFFYRVLFDQQPPKNKNQQTEQTEYMSHENSVDILTLEKGKDALNKK